MPRTARVRASAVYGKWRQGSERAFSGLGTTPTAAQPQPAATTTATLDASSSQHAGARSLQRGHRIPGEMSLILARPPVDGVKSPPYRVPP
ncbi:hypothetical protein IMZ48_49440 [Candidatus Bathyarchaeota archaeon]|nr:hypothetical protein [Candidatus Bathyarchaeota archaeon]